METPNDLNGELTERIMAALRRNNVLRPGVSSYNAAFSIVYEALSDSSNVRAEMPRFDQALPKRANSDSRS